MYIRGRMLYFLRGKMEENNKKKGSFFRELTMIEFSILLIAVVIIILGIIYFVFFTEMDKTLKTIEVQKYGIVP